MNEKAIEYIRKVYQIPNNISVYEQMEGFSIYETVELMEDYHNEKTSDEFKKDIILNFLNFAEKIYWGENEYNDYKKILEQYFKKDTD